MLQNPGSPSPTGEHPMMDTLLNVAISGRNDHTPCSMCDMATNHNSGITTCDHAP